MDLVSSRRVKSKDSMCENGLEKRVGIIFTSIAQ